MLAIIAAGIVAWVQNPNTMMSGWHQPLPPFFGFKRAFIGVFWSIGGWHHISYVSN